MKFFVKDDKMIFFRNDMIDFRDVKQEIGKYTNWSSQLKRPMVIHHKKRDETKQLIYNTQNMNS